MKDELTNMTVKYGAIPDVNGEQNFITEGDMVRIYAFPCQDPVVAQVIKVIKRTQGAIPDGPFYCDDMVVVKINTVFSEDGFSAEMSEFPFHFKQCRKLNKKGAETF